MTKRYMLSREDLQNLIHESITFFSDKVKDFIEKGRHPKFSDRTRWIEEFLYAHLAEYPIDNLLNEAEKEFSSFVGRTFDDIKEDLRAKEPFCEEAFKKVKDFQELLKERNKK